MHSTHTRHAQVSGVGGGFRGGVNIVHSPPSTPTVVGTSGHWSVTGFGGKGGFRCREKRFGVRLQKGPGGSKGDTEGPRISLSNHCVALQVTDKRGELWEGEKSESPEHRRRAYEEEGEVEEEEEWR